MSERPIFSHHCQQTAPSRLLLDGTELLIRECKQPLISTRGINITSFTNFPEEDLIHYFEYGRRNDSLDTF